MADEQTLATEVRSLFKSLGKEPNRRMDRAIADEVSTKAGSVEFYQAVAEIKSKCDQLRRDIGASRIKTASKQLYLGAVDTLLEYIGVAGLTNKQNHQLRAEEQVFEYLTLIDDVLEPQDNRDISAEFLQDIEGKARSILADLEASGIDERLKVFLVKQIQQFLWSISAFEVVGIEGITRAWGAMFAEIARSHGMAGAHKPDAEKWYKKAMPIIGAIGLAVTSVSATIEQADNLLTHGAHIVSVVTGQDEKSVDANKAHEPPADQVKN